jgi:hypothetical protein
MRYSQDEVKREIIEAWRSYIRQADSSLGQLEKEVWQAGENAAQVTGEWLHYVDRVVREIADIVFSIGEPDWAGHGDIETIRRLKKRVYEFDTRLYDLKNSHW